MFKSVTDSMKLTALLWPLLLLTFVLASCAPATNSTTANNTTGGQSGGYATLNIITRPFGGKIRIEESGKVVDSGTSLRVPINTYTFTSFHPDYSGTTITVTLEAGQNNVIVPLQIEPAKLSLVLKPSGTKAVLKPTGSTGKAVLDIDSTTTMPLAVEPGRYLLEVTNPGYVTQSVPLDIQPGTYKSRQITLVAEQAAQKNPTAEKAAATTTSATAVSASGSRTAPLQIQTADDVKIYINGQLIGEGPVSKSLPFDKYDVLAVRERSALMRDTGRKTVVHRSAEDSPVSIEPNQRELLWQKNWWPESDVLAAEAKQFASYQQTNAKQLQVNLSQAVMEQFYTQQKDMRRLLFKIMNVGDCLLFNTDAMQQPFPVCKRQTEFDEWFEQQVETLMQALQGKQQENIWYRDYPAIQQQLDADGEGNLWLVLLSALNSGSGKTMLALDGVQLQANGEVIQRVRSDGELTVWVFGGSVSIKGVSGQYAGQGIEHFRVPAASNELVISWLNPPEAVFVLAEEPLLIQSPPTDVTLYKRQKNIWPFGEVQVQQVLRFSHGPEYDGWLREEIEMPAGLGARHVLDEDELGPHTMAGSYRRYWILVLETPQGETWRQITADYKVLDQEQ